VTKGQHLTLGSRKVDYTITVGDANCLVSTLTDNQVECRPPASKPKKNANGTFCDEDTRSLQVNTRRFT